jgi:hypothetical protein
VLAQGLGGQGSRFQGLKCVEPETGLSSGVNSCSVRLNKMCGSVNRCPEQTVSKERYFSFLLEGSECHHHENQILECLGDCDSLETHS